MIQTEILTSFVNAPFHEISKELPITHVLHVQLLRISAGGVESLSQSLPEVGAGKALPYLIREGLERNMAANIAKVRIVRCPKCLELLPEPNIPVYQCGGCNSFLRAKRPGESSRSRTAETNPVQNNEVTHAADSNESIISSQQLKVCPTDANISDVEHPAECEKANTSNGDKGNSTALPSPKQLDNCGQDRSTVTAVERDDLNESEREDSNYESPVHGERSDENEERHSDVGSSIVPNCRIQSKSCENKQEEISQPPENHSCNTTSLRDEVDGSELPIHHKKFSEDSIDTKPSRAAGYLSKLPTRSSHAYDASISSLGDILEQHVTRHQNQSSKSLLKPPSNKLKSNREGIQIKGKMIVNKEMQNHKTELLSMPLNEYDSANGESSNWNHDHPLKPVRNGFQAPEQGSLQEEDVFHSVKSWVESERDGLHRYPLSRDSSYEWEAHSTYEHGGPSNYRHEELLSGPNSCAPDKLDYLEKDHIELLKKVEELRDQLSRSIKQRGREKEKLPIRNGPQEQQWPSSYDMHHHSHELLPPHHKMSHLPNHHQPYIPRQTMLQQYGVPQMPFSRQPTTCQPHYDHACLHWCCEGQQFPTHSPASVYSRTGLPQSFPRQPSYYSFSSSPSQPQLRRKSGLSQHHRVSFPHERRLVGHEVEKLQHRQRRQTVKRHCLPLADGAPFIICNRCWKVLQLPADFLASKKGRHKLRCGHCSKMLTFSLGGEKRNAASSFHIDGILQADPVSYSDDYGAFTSKSYSTEREPLSFASSIPGNGSGWYYKTQRGSNSMKPQADKGQTRMNPEHSGEREGRNESQPSEGSLDMKRSASPLHRLMGYSSVSEVFHGPRDSRFQHAEWE